MTPVGQWDSVKPYVRKKPAKRNEAFYRRRMKGRKSRIRCSACGTEYTGYKAIGINFVCVRAGELPDVTHTLHFVKDV